MDIIIGIFSTAVGLASILCIYISVAEIKLIHEKREKVKTDLNHTLKYSKEFFIEEILSLLVTNDIIEIWFVSNNKIIEIGSSSDCREGSAQFFDKRYYVNDNEFINIGIYNKKGKMMNRKKYLYFVFDSKEHVSVAVVRAITKKEARKILLFLNKNVDPIDICRIKMSKRNRPLNRIRILSMY